MTAVTDFQCKYAELERVFPLLTAELQAAVDACPVTGRSRLFIDVKVQNLRVGQYTCVAGWHRDTITDPRVRHHLFVLGANRTEFLGADGVVFKIPEGEWHSYGHDLHRGPRCLVSERRVLLRITESDVIRPVTIIRRIEKKGV